MSDSILPVDSRNGDFPDNDSAANAAAQDPAQNAAQVLPQSATERVAKRVVEPGPKSAGSRTGSLQNPVDLLAELQRQMNRLQREIRVTIQAQLAQMTGRNLGSIEQNRELAKSIHAMLDAHGLRVRCPHCGNAAILRVSPRSGAPAGVFVFDHTINGKRTFHGGRTTVPEIRLVAKPPRKSNQSNSIVP